MNQKRLLIVLAGTALVVLAVAGIGVGGSSLGWFGGDDGPGAGQRAARGIDAVDAEAADFEANIVGSDANGPYRSGEDGVRVYRDEQGRYFTVDADGKRVFTDAMGRADRAGSDRGGTGLVQGSGAAGEADSGKGGKTAEDAKDKDAEDKAGECTLTGSVVDETGQPYSGAAITAEIAGAGKQAAASNDEGAFALQGLPAGKTILLTARNADGNASKTVTTRLAAGATKLPEPLVVPRDTSIRGGVRSAETGAALAGAEIVLFEGADKFGFNTKVRATAFSAADGSFTFPKLSQAYYRLQISRDGFAPQMLASVTPPRNLDVVLQAGAAISGRITNPEGGAVTGAVIACDFDAEPAQRFHTEAQTDADGFYAVRCQPESQHNVLRVVAPGYHARTRNFVRSGASAIDFVLQPTGNIVLRGRVLNKAGTGVANATLAALNAQNKGAGIAQRVGPAADGGFWCEVVPEAVTLRIRAPNLLELLVPFTGTAGGEVNLGDLVMDGGYAVTGIVREIVKVNNVETQIPIAGATLTAAGLTAQSDEQGRFRIEGLKGSEFWLGAKHSSYANAGVKVVPVAAVYEIECNIQMYRIKLDANVMVKDAKSQALLSGVLATVTTTSQTVTSVDGLVAFRGLSQFSVMVRFEKAGYATVEERIIGIAPDKLSTTPAQEVQMLPGDRIAGVCTGGGEPLPGGAKVEIWNITKLVVTVLTDSEGEYTTESLPLGDYFVGLPDYGLAARPLTLEAEGAELNLEIGPVCHLRGRALRHGGAAHASAGVYIYRRDNVYHTATVMTDPEGRYEVQNLFPGEWVFCALKSQGDAAAQFSVKVNVTAAGWNNVDVQLPQNTGVMTGRATYSGGGLVRNARVSVTNLSANFTRACLAAYVVTDANGLYRAERLENGCQMIARVGGYIDQAQTAIGFSEAVLIPANETPVEANIVVARESVTFNVPYRRADGGPLLTGSAVAYLLDNQGRLAGLFFGGGLYAGTMKMLDVGPGNYTLFITMRGCKLATTNFSVSEGAPVVPEVLIELEPRNPG